MNAFETQQGHGRGNRAAHERLLPLLEVPPAELDMRHGYLDLLDAAPPEPTGLVGRMMLSPTVSRLYARWWRTFLHQVTKGITGPRMSDELRMVREMLALKPGDTVLDVACGPGNITKSLSDAVGEHGLVIGLDGSAAMLRQAVASSPGRNTVFVRADALEFPLRKNSVDGVACFASLQLFSDPMRALDRMTDALAPGGRIALLTSCRPTGPVRGPICKVLNKIGGIHVFSAQEITGALAERGFTEIDQQIHAMMQFVSARLAA